MVEPMLFVLQVTYKRDLAAAESIIKGEFFPHHFLYALYTADLFVFS